MATAMKLFKVVQIGQRPLRGGCHLHLVVAADGDCWQVARNRDRPRPVAWHVGEVVEVAMRVVTAAGSAEERFVAPLWDALQATDPVKYDLSKPYEAVTAAWGEEHAKKFFDPD